MREEVCAAVKFFACFIEKSETFPREQLGNFERHLTELLIERFEKHWFPDLPSRGQGYRCIRVNGLNPVDLTLEMAASKCGLRYTDLRLPKELTVWVDPSEVCYRLGESEGSYCTLATFPSEAPSSASSASAPSSPRPSSDGSPVPSPSSTPPATPLQERHLQLHGATRKGAHYKTPGHHQQQPQQRHHPGGGAFAGFEYAGQMAGGKYRGHSGYAQAPVSIRTKQSPREMNFSFNPNHRPMFRCDGPPYPMAPPFIRNMNYKHYKNALRV